MNKYTAEDFANARFAEHPDGTLAARFYDGGFPEDEPGDDRAWESPGDYHTDQDMSRFGWVPVPTKPTITESEFHETADAHRNGGLGWEDLARRFGITIVPDPEPTNAEKLADVYRSWCGRDEVPNSLIRFMDEAGVTAPEETK